jgi:hypothetical protein
VAVSQQHSTASFAMLRFLVCFHLPAICCSCCNAVQFCCDLEAYNLVMDTKKNNL